MADVVIRHGTVVDGTGAPRREADVAIKDGKILAVGTGLNIQGAEEIDATGRLVCPGWVDCHTHYDAQVGWDSQMSPSCWHGVTTVVFGNCGVTFAPCWQDDHDFLIELMEGVEDIPGTALHDGIAWKWETFPEFMDFLETRPAVMDFAPQIGHGAIRSFVMGERSVDPTADPSEEELAAMADVVQEAIEAGAAGLSSTFAEIHQDVHGNNVPGCFATTAECVALAKGAGRAGYAVYETAGAPDIAKNVADGSHPMEALVEIGQETTVSFLCNEQGMRRSLEWLEKVNASGSRVFGQVFNRAQGLLLGLDGVINIFAVRSPTYCKHRTEPLPQRIKSLQNPAVRAAILDEYDQTRGEGDPLTLQASYNFENMWIMDAFAPDYEPLQDKCIEQIANERGLRPQEVLLDALLADDGHGVVWYPYQHGYNKRNYDNIRLGMTHPLTVYGNADAGAHVAAFTDASCTTFTLSFWGRDRTRGPKIPIEELVKSQARDPARLYGWEDRGTLEPGMRADLNVIDLDELRIHRPEVASDLPSGASRWIQRASGYVLTMCNGVITFRDGVGTGATPGRLIRNPSTAAKRAAGTELKLSKDRLRELREGGRGGFDIQAGVDRSGFVAHMPGPISQAFYRVPGMSEHLANMRQQNQHLHQQTGKL